MIVLLKIQLCKVGIYKIRIFQAKHRPGKFSMICQILSLFNSEKRCRGFIVRSCQAKFSYPATNIQYLSTVVGVRNCTTIWAIRKGVQCLRANN